MDDEIFKQPAGRGRGGQGGNCIIWQNIYLYCSTTLRVSILPEVTNIKILRNEIL